jgi:hypothetical protein
MVLSGLIDKAEMEQWLEDAKPILADIEVGFGVFVDMRDLLLLPPESQPAAKEGQILCRAEGMVRSVVILSDDITAMQFRRIAKQTGIYEWERYIDAAAEPNWKQVGEDWLVDGVDPDLRPKNKQSVTST